MPNCQRARVSGAKARSTSSVSLHCRHAAAVCPFCHTHHGSNRDALVNAFTFTSHYGALIFDNRQGVPLGPFGPVTGPRGPCEPPENARGRGSTGHFTGGPPPGDSGRGPVGRSARAAARAPC